MFKKSKPNKRKSIPKKIKQLVWNKYIGERHGIGLCFCCKSTEISQMSFHCGHIVSDYHGGSVTIENLAPICALCNLSMGKTNMYEFMETYGFTNKSLINKQISKPLISKPLIDKPITINKNQTIETNKYMIDDLHKYLNELTDNKLILICILLSKGCTNTITNVKSLYSADKETTINKIIKNDHTLDEIHELINYWKSESTIISNDCQFYHNEFIN
jgi:hypothetical protein